MPLHLLHTTVFILCVVYMASASNVTKQAHAPLDPAAVAQTNISAEEYSRIPSVGGFSVIWFFGHPNTFYHVSMGSQHLYRSYAEVLFGRLASSQAELDDMDLRINFYFSVPSYKAVTEGESVGPAGQKVVHTLKQNCWPNALEFDFSFTGMSRAMCLPTSTSQGVRSDLVASSYDKVVWQSKKDGAVLITRFVNNAVTDWKVLSLTKHLPEETQSVILAKVRALGLII